MEGVRSEHLVLSPLALNHVSVKNISYVLSVMKVLFSVLFAGLLTERPLNRAIKIPLARVGLVCRGIVIRSYGTRLSEISLEPGRENTRGYEFNRSSFL